MRHTSRVFRISGDHLRALSVLAMQERESVPNTLRRVIEEAVERRAGDDPQLPFSAQHPFVEKVRAERREKESAS